MIDDLQCLAGVIVERTRGFLVREALPNEMYRQDAQAILSSAENLAQLLLILPRPDRRQPPFLSSYNNDIRGELNTILGFSRTMASLPKLYDDQPLSSPQYVMVEAIGVSGRQLLRATSDLVDYSLIYAGRMELDRNYFDVQSVIGCLAKPDPVTLNALAVDTAISADIPKLYGDELRTQQVLAKVMTAANTLVQPTRFAIFIHDHDLDDDRRAIQIHIDHPPGSLTSEQVSALFNPHSALQAKNIDLYIAHSLTKLQHGTLVFENISLQHSIFTISLPIFPAD